MVNIKLSAMDGAVQDVDRDVLLPSVTLNNMLRDSGLLDSDADKQTEPIQLNNISGGMLQKVIDWCTYHKNDPPIAEDADPLSTEICAWDMEFLKVDLGTMYDLMLAANYLGVNGLLKVACKTVADMMKGKSITEIRELFNVQNDFTPEEIEEMKKENPFLED